MVMLDGIIHEPLNRFPRVVVGVGGPIFVGVVDSMQEVEHRVTLLQGGSVARRQVNTYVAICWLANQVSFKREPVHLDPFDLASLCRRQYTSTEQKNGEKPCTFQKQNP